LVLDFNGKRLELSGLTDEERRFSSSRQHQYASDHPGEFMPVHFSGDHFKVGDTVTFKYRELSDDGIPKEARYWRKP
jgi:putative hemolysin